MRPIMSRLARIRRELSLIPGLDEKIDQVAINEGIILGELHRQKNSRNLRDYEYKVFSQWGEDGIIQRLISVIGIANKTFIEFGVEDFSESNCRYLLMKDNWSGFVIDGSAQNIAKLKNYYYYWRYGLTAISSFITRENINQLLAQSGFGKELGILSIDIDGNDYWIWEAIDGFSPAVMIVEYNSRFGSQRKVTIPYDPAFSRTTAHYSNLYYGASLAALCLLGKKKGYSFVGSNSAGNNAFFVRSDLMSSSIPELTPEEGYVLLKYRESRAEDFSMSFLTREEEAKILEGLPLVEIS
jgi:hypothetical protein